MDPQGDLELLRLAGMASPVLHLSHTPAPCSRTPPHSACHALPRQLLQPTTLAWPPCTARRSVPAACLTRACCAPGAR